MSAQGWLLPLSCIVLTLAPRAWAGPQTPQTQPAAESASGSPVPQTRPVSIGSINESMRHLATIPRPRTAREAAAVDSQRRPPAKELPYSKVLPSPEPGLPPVIERRSSLVSARAADRMPSSEEMRRAFPNAHFPAATAPSSDPHAVPGAVVPPAAWPHRYAPSGSGLPGFRRDYANYRYFDGRPSLYGHGYHDYPYGGDDADAIYRFGFLQGADYWRFYDESNARTEYVLKHYSGHLAKALELFNRGQYTQAADAFRLAAETHQGDPAARLYAAHALFAIGRYRDAIPYLRRAYELQPRFIYLGYDIRDDYGQAGDFENHLAALQEAQRRDPTNLDRLVLLGYVFYFSEQRDRAYELLVEANRLRRGDPLITALLNNSRPPDVMLEATSNR